MLSSLAQSDLCRAGIIALLKDIINGQLPERARQLLLSSRLVALSKPGGSYRPIAVGELFYRLAGVLVVRKVTEAAAGCSPLTSRALVSAAVLSSWCTRCSTH